MEIADVVKGLGSEELASAYRANILFAASVVVDTMASSSAASPPTEVGKCLRAKEAIAKGSVILHERAAAWVDSDATNLCNVPEELFAIQQTVEQAISVLESPLATEIVFKSFCPHSRDHPVFAQRGDLLKQGAVMIAKRLQSMDPAKATAIRARLVSHTTTTSSSSSSSSSATPPPLTPTLLLLLAKIQLNSFDLPRPSGGKHAFCVVGFAAHMNHSCAPNACHYLDHANPAHPSLVVRAVRDIAPGEEICITYVELYQPRIARKEDLEHLYLFTCACARCSDETPGAVDHVLDAFKGASLPSGDVVRRIVRLNTEAREARDKGETTNALALFQNLVREGDAILHPQHHWMHFARADIARCQMRLGRHREAVPEWDTVIEQARHVYGAAWPTTAGHENMRITALRALLRKHAEEEEEKGKGKGKEGERVGTEQICNSSEGGEGEIAKLKERLEILEREYEEGLRVCRGRQCEACKKHVVREMTCSRCKAVVYCSRECQVAAWASHKGGCSSR